MNTNLYHPQFVLRHVVREVANPILMNDALAQEIKKVSTNLISSYSAQTIASLNGRLERGLELALIGSVQPTPTQNQPHRCRVISSDRMHSYEVDTDSRTCECPDSLKGNQCKHRIAAYYYQQAAENIARAKTPIQVVQQPAKPADPVSEPSARSVACANQILKDLEPKKVAEVPEPLFGARLGFLYRRYLHGDDLGPKSFKATITNVTKEKVGTQQSREPLERWCLWLNGLPQGFPSGVLFGPQGEKELLAIFGRANLENLKGKVLEVYSQSVDISGKPKMLVHFRKCA